MHLEPLKRSTRGNHGHAHLMLRDCRSTDRRREDFLSRTCANQFTRDAPNRLQRLSHLLPAHPNSPPKLASFFGARAGVRRSCTPREWHRVRRETVSVRWRRGSILVRSEACLPCCGSRVRSSPFSCSRVVAMPTEICRSSTNLCRVRWER